MPTQMHRECSLESRRISVLNGPEGTGSALSTIDWCPPCPVSISSGNTSSLAPVSLAYLHASFTRLRFTCGLASTERSEATVTFRSSMLILLFYGLSLKLMLTLCFPDGTMRYIQSDPNSCLIFWTGFFLPDVTLSQTFPCGIRSFTISPAG